MLYNLNVFKKENAFLFKLTHRKRVIMIISEKIKQIAYKHTQERIKYEYDRFKLDYQHRFDMILIGTIGQLCFKEFLDKNNIVYNYEFQAGKYDNYDFEINGKIVEVKTSGYKDTYLNYNLQYNVEQYYNEIFKNYYACVQIFINGYDRQNKIFDLQKCDTVNIVGFAYFDEIENAEKVDLPYTKAFRIPLKKLHKIENLIDQFKKSEN